MQTRRPFCKSCYDADKGKSVYLSHNHTDTRCPIRIQLSSFTEDHLPLEVLESELIDYTFSSQVDNSYHTNQHPANHNLAGLRSIQPVAAQILSVAGSDGRPLHIELDSAATVSYITLQEAKRRRLVIKPNNQVSHLGDGLTPLKSCGEIDTILYRNEHLLRFRALVAQNLHCTAIGGTTFI